MKFPYLAFPGSNFSEGMFRDQTCLTQKAFLGQIDQTKCPHLVFSASNCSKRVFRDVLDTKMFSRLHISLEDEKFAFFAKGLVYNFGQKLEVFSPCFF